MSDLNLFAQRYIAVWNEPDPELRRKAITELFSANAVHLTPSQEIHGHEQLEVRIATAYEKWVEPGEHVFRAVPNANGHHDAVRFNWHMVHLASDTAVAVGFDFILLDEDRLIVSDHQFVES
jgi:hypothetical protein